MKLIFKKFDEIVESANLSFEDLQNILTLIKKAKRDYYFSFFIPYIKNTHEGFCYYSLKNFEYEDRIRIWYFLELYKPSINSEINTGYWFRCGHIKPRYKLLKELEKDLKEYLQ